MALGGCNRDPLTNAVNAACPPVDVAQQRQTAIDSSVDALTRLALPNLAVTVSLADVKTVLEGELQKLGIQDFDLEGDKQLLKISIKFDRHFDKQDSAEPNIASALDSLKPHIVGKVVAYAGMTGGVTPEPDAPRLELRVLPALSSIEVSKIELADGHTVGPVGEVIVAALNHFRDNISGVLSSSPLTSVSVPALSSTSFDGSGPIQTGDPNVKVSLSARPITAPFRLDGIACLVTDRQITAIAQLSPVAGTAPTKTVAVDRTYNGVKGRVTEIVEQVLEVPDADSRTWAAIKKDVIAVSMNSAFEQAEACFSVQANIPNQHSENKVPMPNGAGVNCDITRSCDPKRDCTFSAKQDTRDCSACVLRTPRICGPWHSGCIGGQCSAMGQDPVCQVAKASQQTLYNLDANARKADCDRLRESDRLACQAEVATEHALCQVKKTALDALGKSGNFANIDVDASLNTQDTKVCLQNFTLSPALDHIQATLEVTGRASGDVHVNFVPLDLGNIVCPIKWSKSVHLQAALRENRLNVSSAVALSTDGDTLKADFKTDKTPVKASVRPGPTELLLESPQMLAACPVVDFVAPVVVQLTPLLPPLRGDFDMSVPEQQATVPLKPLRQTIGGRPLTLTVNTTVPAVVVSAKVGDETLKADTTAPDPATLAGR